LCLQRDVSTKEKGLQEQIERQILIYTLTFRLFQYFKGQACRFWSYWCGQANRVLARYLYDDDILGIHGAVECLPASMCYCIANCIYSSS
jgi:hypothetical protein